MRCIHTVEAKGHQHHTGNDTHVNIALYLGENKSVAGNVLGLFN